MPKSKEPSPAYQMYAKEWLSCSDVMLMEAHQEGAYIRLINYDWVNDGILNNPRVLSQLGRIPESDLDIVVNKFIDHPKKPGYLSHPRVQKERKKQANFKKEKSKAGKAGAKKRWQKTPQVIDPESDKGDGTAIAHPMANDGSPSPIPTAIAIADNINTPKSPKRGSGRRTIAEKKLTKVESNTLVMIRIGSWFGRKAGSLWSIYEEDRLNLIEPIDPDDLTAIEKYYTEDIPNEKDYRRRDLQTLLNNWTGELDRARNWKPGGKEYDGYIKAKDHPDNDWSKAGQKKS